MTFYANPSTRRVESNGAISYAQGGPWDCLGPFAKVENCPVVATRGNDRLVLTRRYTVRATGYADTAWTVPSSRV